ncbi:MAG: bifunctional oligoribonuclease/PAP phosphatase NrnA [Haloarculaceae archaeon]
MTVVSDRGPAAALVEALSGTTALGVVCHDDPDPDCLASAAALGAIACWAGVPTVTYFDGAGIADEASLSLARYLGVTLTRADPASLSTVDALALVDHALPGVHNSLPADTPVDLIVDHHEYDQPVAGAFVDVRSDYGAAASILVEYLTVLGVPVSPPLATGLLYALHRERLDSVRYPTAHEYWAASWLLPLVEFGAIDRLYRSERTSTTVDALAVAITNRRVDGTSLVTWVGETGEHVALAKAADFLLTMRGVDNVLVSGVVDGALHLSARSTDARVDLGRLLPRLVGERGRAGGHLDMAGAVVSAAELPPPSTGDPTGAAALADELASAFTAVVESTNAPDGSTAPPPAGGGLPR